MTILAIFSRFLDIFHFLGSFSLYLWFVQYAGARANCGRFDNLRNRKVPWCFKYTETHVLYAHNHTIQLLVSGENRIGLNCCSFVVRVSKDYWELD